MIGIFNRSYYEEVLVTRVHPELLDGGRTDRGMVPPNNCGAIGSRTSTPLNVIWTGMAQKS